MMFNVKNNIVLILSLSFTISCTSNISESNEPEGIGGLERLVYSIAKNNGFDKPKSDMHLHKNFDQGISLRHSHPNPKANHSYPSLAAHDISFIDHAHKDGVGHNHFVPLGIAHFH